MRTITASQSSLTILHVARPEFHCKRRNISCYFSKDHDLNKSLEPSNATRGGNVTVSWVLKHRCQFGQQVAVVGSLEELGNWSPEKGVFLQWTDGDLWRGHAALEPGTTMDYKYVITGEGQGFYWKPGDNLKLELKAPPGANVSVMESWEDAQRNIQVDKPAGRTPQTINESPEQQPSVSKVSPMATLVQTESVLELVSRETLMDLKEAMKLHDKARKQTSDPAAIENIEADRILAATNNKVMALSKAVKAANDFPQLRSH
ncbi:hypothetical protein CEUSTIGMA_g13162.t1 [Chlamydomonas eustigma]|uniref:CBM20 domain-containing protein n=1 Tax=Chlamydomonas eustigma TaxID=1157962 RepID=A0A250XRP0_9CHLO|nr:hypothetical protein CEUSTIGMA_g13162.t1 [Chlamydomonas eustigma]|eukprot:GAX85747.1 hypothetical protein CEUSTIGMA_g13162.t1 [Chlamydomonas eustigma]